MEDLRRRTRQFFDTLPALIDGIDDRLVRARTYRAALFDAGLAGLTYPTEFGGHGLTDEDQRVFDEESAGRRTADDDVFGIGLGMAIPTILEHGSDDLKRRFVTPALRGEEVWCQLYSEPGAGSDLASLQTRAVADGDQWIVTGQKVWTSGAQHSQLGIVLARTDVDAPKHRGISMLVLPMEQPGVTVRPLRQMTGVAEFNEVFIDEASVPRDWVVGDVNGGWRMAVALLAHERRSLGGGAGRGGGRQPIPVSRIIDEARRRGATDDPLLRGDIAALHTGELLSRWVRQRGVHPSIGKLWRTRQGRAAAAVAHRLALAGGAAWSDDDHAGASWGYAVLDAPALSLGGGTDEVQRNTLGERVLDLPREPSVDTDVPFRELAVGTQRRGQTTP